MNIDWAFQQEVIYKELIENDGWGRPLYADDVITKARAQYKQRLIKAPDGNDIMSNLEIWAPITITPKADDRFVYRGQLFRVITADLPPSLYGETGHWKIYLESVVDK